MARNHFTVTLEGVDLGTFNDDDLTLGDAFVLENETGMTINQMLAGLQAYRAGALRALVWFMKFKYGTTVPLLSIDFKLNELVTTGVVDPTKAKAPRKRRGITTSVPSPIFSI